LASQPMPMTQEADNSTLLDVPKIP